MTKSFFSNTCVGTCNNSLLKLKKQTKITSRIFYKVTSAGQFNYKFYFSNKVFSTFDNGSNSKANDNGNAYKLIRARVGVCGGVNVKNIKFSPLMFFGKKTKWVDCGEDFWSDEINLTVKKEDYLIFEWTVKGDCFAYTPDKIIPSFVKKGFKFIANTSFPQPCMVACDKQIQKRVIFLGDSITQGLGTEDDKYEFWVANIAKGLPERFGVWNIGLGFGRIQDVATNGAWMDIAKKADIVNICFGVNDIIQGRSEKQVKEDLTSVVNTLVEGGIKVGLFTVPPFDFVEEKEKIRNNINKYILDDLSKKTMYTFDMATLLSKEKPSENIAKYNGHPNGVGCAVVAENFLRKVDLDD